MKRAHSPSTHDHKDTPKKTMAAGANDIDITDIFMSEHALFRQVAGFLHWKDATTTLGVVCKDFRKVYLENRDVILQPLLKLLDALCKSNVHWCCRKVYAPASKRTCTCRSIFSLDDYELQENQALASLDPRYEEAYESLPIQC